LKDIIKCNCKRKRDLFILSKKLKISLFLLCVRSIINIQRESNAKRIMQITLQHDYKTDTLKYLIAGHSIPVESFGRIQLWGDLMQIRRVDAQDAGRYVCRASNQLGEQRAETHLSVTSKLNARIQPRVQVRV